MYEDMNKYAIRGSTMLEYTGSKEGGDMKIDASSPKQPNPCLILPTASGISLEQQSINHLNS
jgi:hypothetical protein